MKFAKVPRCLYVETHAQRAYFVAFVQFAKQEDVNLHMKNLASFASLREIKTPTPDGSKGEATCKFCGLKTSVNGIINKILCILCCVRLKAPTPDGSKGEAPTRCESVGVVEKETRVH